MNVLEMRDSLIALAYISCSILSTPLPCTELGGLGDGGRDCWLTLKAAGLEGLGLLSGYHLELLRFWG